MSHRQIVCANCHLQDDPGECLSRSCRCLQGQRQDSLRGSRRSVPTAAGALQVGAVDAARRLHPGTRTAGLMRSAKRPKASTSASTATTSRTSCWSVQHPVTITGIVFPVLSPDPGPTAVFTSAISDPRRVEPWSQVYPTGEKSNNNVYTRPLRQHHGNRSRRQRFRHCHHQPSGW